LAKKAPGVVGLELLGTTIDYKLNFNTHVERH